MQIKKSDKKTKKNEELKYEEKDQKNKKKGDVESSWKVEEGK